jgi:hypothetical protein
MNTMMCFVLKTKENGSYDNKNDLHVLNFLYIDISASTKNHMLECCCFFHIRHVLYILELLNMLEFLLLNFCTCYMSSKFAYDACYYFFNIRSAIVSKKHSELTKKQA